MPADHRNVILVTFLGYGGHEGLWGLDACKLCLQMRELQDGHLMPRALYKKSRWEGGGNPYPTLVTERTIVQTSKQIKDFVFCRDCEQRLSRNGERYVMSLVAEKGSFPLLVALQTIKPSSVTPVFTHYDLMDLPEIDRAQLAYYAISIFWRTSIHVVVLKFVRRRPATSQAQCGGNAEVWASGFPSLASLRFGAPRHDYLDDSQYDPP